MNPRSYQILGSSLISTSDPWYDDIFLSLQTQWFRPKKYCDDRRCIHHQYWHYLIINDYLYQWGVETVLCQFSIQTKAEHVLSDYHVGACDGHLFALAISQKILCSDYFLPTLFKDCIMLVQKCHPCHIFLVSCVLTLPHYIQSFLSKLFTSEVMISFNVI